MSRERVEVFMERAADNKNIRYFPQDISIFVLSYNRGQYLLETVQCLREQTVQVKYTIIDNASSGTTQGILEELKNRGTNVIINDTNVGVKGSIELIQKLSDKEWTIIFHDDDWIHPRYIEHVLIAINSVERPAFVGAEGFPTLSPAKEKWQEKVEVSLKRFKDVTHFAHTVFKGAHFPFCSAVYRTERFKNISIREDLYGKSFDMPLVFTSIAEGDIFLLQGGYIQIRTHKGQESNNYGTGPFPNQWIELTKVYRQLFYSSSFPIFKWSFRIKGLKYLMLLFTVFKANSDVTPVNYLNAARRNNAISLPNILTGLPYYMLWILAKPIRFLRKMGQ